MTATAATGGSRLTFRNDAERRTTKVLLARALVKQARYLHHPVDPQVQAYADARLDTDPR